MSTDAQHHVPNRDHIPSRDREGADNARLSNTPLPDGRGSEREGAVHGGQVNIPLPDGRGSVRLQNSEGMQTHRSPGGPLAFLITFHTYGTWLHGDEVGSVDREHNIPGSPHALPDARRQRAALNRLKHPAVLFDAPCRKAVEKAIIDVCQHRDWTLHALNVRTNHVHVVVGADELPERIMGAFKSWSTRRMKHGGLLRTSAKVWTRHGSTRYLWKMDEVTAACGYVCDGQGTDLPTQSRTTPE